METTPNPLLQPQPQSVSLQPQPLVRNSDDIVAEVARAHSMLSPEAKGAVDKAHGILSAQPQAPEPQPQQMPTIMRPGTGGPMPSLRMSPAEETAQAPDASPQMNSTIPLPQNAASYPSDRLISPNQATSQFLRDSGTGVSQIHNPWARGLATAADAIGSGLFPRIAAVIPGTTSHHNMLQSQADQGVTQDETLANNASKRAQEAATTANEQSQIPLNEARTEEQKALASKASQTPVVTKEWQEITGGAIDPDHPELGTQPAFYNKNNPKEGITFGNAKAGVKPVAVKEGEEPLGPDRVAQLNAANKARYQVLHPGGELPPHYTIPANATQKDYDRIDKAMESTEKALGTKAQQDQLNEMHKQTMALAQKKEERAETKADPAVEREYSTVRKDLNTQFESAQKQIESINAAKEELKGGAVGQAVGTIKTIVALAGGQGSGVRVTQPELNALIHARGIKGDFDGWLSKLEGKGTYPPDQLAQINQVLADVEAKAHEKSNLHAGFLDKLGGAKTTAEIRSIESDYRKALMGTGEKTAGGGKEPTMDEINAEVERRKKAKSSGPK